VTAGLPLFDFIPEQRAHARHRDPLTSKSAAVEIEEKLPQLQRIVLDALESMGDATCEEVSDRVGLERVTISPRFKPMEAAGLIERVVDPGTGKQRTRPGKSGRPSGIWRVKLRSSC
jgi:DNA-binding MarR family transcriptional regulator